MRKRIVTVLFVAVLIVAGVYFGTWWPWLHDRLTRKDTVDFLTSIGGIAAVLALVGGIIAWLIKQWQAEKEKKPGEPSPAPTYITHINNPAVPAEKPIAPPLHQLPAPPADFIGRAEEFNDLLTKVKVGGVAISGVHGMGGVGKTALALKLAEKLKADYPDAQIYLDLKGVSDSAVTPKEAMAHVIRAWHPTTQPPDDDAQLGAFYRSLLDGKRVLLLMDNARDAAQVQSLLPPAGCLMLVTSRQRFTLPGIEQRNLDELAPGDARDFLLKIAPRLKKEKTVAVNELARLCGHLPLALRAVGSALQARADLPLSHYARRLQDTEKRLLLKETDTSRQLNTEAVLQSSYELLGKELQERFGFLAVFPETFDLAAAAEVWETQDDGALDSLGELLAYSLVEFDEANRRYSLHDLVHLFAGQKLSENDEEKREAERRHALHYLRVLGSADELYLKGGEFFTKGLALFDLEWVNVRTGQAWAASQAVSDNRAAEACWQYPNAGENCLFLRQHPRDRIKWLDAALSAARRLKQRGWEGNVLSSLGIAYGTLGEYRRAIGYFDQQLTISRELGFRAGEATALGNLGVAHNSLGEYRRAIACLDRQLTIAREIGDRRGEGTALGNLGNAYSNLGEQRRAIEYQEQRLAIAREIGDRLGEETALGNLGNAYAILGEHRHSIEYHDQTLSIAREIGDRQGEGAALGNLGTASAILGEYRRAIEYFDQALLIASEIGDRDSEGTHLWNSALALNELGNRHEAIARAEAALKVRESIESPKAQKVRDELAEWRGEKGKGATGQSS